MSPICSKKSGAKNIARNIWCRYEKSVLAQITERSSKKAAPRHLGCTLCFPREHLLEKRLKIISFYPKPVLNLLALLIIIFLQVTDLSG